MHVTIYSDGSSRGNPGPGGYGSVLHYTDPSGKLHVKELSQGFRLHNQQSNGAFGRYRRS